MAREPRANDFGSFQKVVDERTNDGVFVFRDPRLNADLNLILPIKDDKTGETLPFEFVEIHQPVRHLKKEGQYFACTDFRKPGSQDAYYDIDFWVDQTSGKLEVKDVKIHKVKTASGPKSRATPSMMRLLKSSSSILGLA